MRGKNAAQARPTSAFAAAMRRSAAAISGRRSSNSLGTATGMPGLASRASFAAASAPFVASSPNAGAGWPVRVASACRKVARCSCTAGICASVVASWVSAWETPLLSGCPQILNEPNNTPVIGPGGVIYITTTLGPADGLAGTVTSLTPPASPGDSWTETLVKGFGGTRGGGIYPFGIAIGSNGALYGVTGGGGSESGGSHGTVYELSPPTRSEERRVGKECRSRWSPYH